MTRWTLLVPVKDLSRAKSRLHAPAGLDRSALARAFALDTIAAAASCPAVAAVWVVSDAPHIAASGGPRVHLLAGAPEGLNPALGWAVRASAVARTGAVAALTADLPALRPEHLSLALQAAAQHDYAVVPDAHGTGTTLLAALHPARFAPRFGGSSFAAHLADGASPVDAPPGLRLDVDTAEDLLAARELGVGVHTETLLRRQSNA